MIVVSWEEDALGTVHSSFKDETVCGHLANPVFPLMFCVPEHELPFGLHGSVLERRS